MSDGSTAVALLFDDAELGGQLRAALCERGARIVHEGPLASLDHDQLRAAGAEVVVVNLDDDADDEALDRLYTLVEGGQPRVVFNDAQASRHLDGWDRARWARHLAMKALASGDVDPPRPADARPLESPPAAVESPAAAASPGEDVLPLEDAPAAFPGEALETHSAAESESLAAELEALLAAGEEPAAEVDEFGRGLKYDADAELPPLYEGDFGRADALETEHADPPAAEPAPDAAAQPPFRTDHLSLASVEEASEPLAATATAASSAVVAPKAPAWALLGDETAPVAVEPEQPEAGDFGIEKVSAADFLAPEAQDVGEPPIEPGFSLELVSLEEAVAPQDYLPHEVRLDELDSALGRLVVLGAARDSVASVCVFLASLPLNLRLPLLLTQHLADEPLEELTQALAEHSTLPVRVAAVGQRAKPGEVLVVPGGQALRVLRDGRVELQSGETEASSGPSIDASFTMAANVFGRNALGIVFAGEATDAVAGSQAIHDRGGQVWVEASPNEHYSDMVHGVLAERLASFSGTPQELAARLSEEYR